MNYKGFSLPGDLLLILSVFIGLLKYSWLASRNPMPQLLQQIRNGRIPITSSADNEDLIELDKRWRAATFLLTKVFKTDKPCLPRTLVLYEWCCRKGMNTRTVIAVQKENEALAGHSWLILEDQPFREDLENIKNYTVMLEG